MIPSGPDSTGPSARHLYLHVPFCRRRCSYCDFSIAVRKSVPTRAFIDAIMAECATRSIRPEALALDTLYLGGGTPSQLGGAGLAELVGIFPRTPSVEGFPTSGTEVTVEANPEDVDGSEVQAWVAAGVNRVSLGVQSFNPAVLDWMHRSHGPEGARRAVEILRSGGVGNLSLDLIFGVPEVLGRDWSADLDAALALEPEHLSVYGLTVEPHTPLGRWTARGSAVEIPEDSWAAEFLEADRRLQAAGYEHYEVSNYAKPGFRSRHNSSYWQGTAYLGLGPSAHGVDGKERRWSLSAYAAWEEAVSKGADPIEGSEMIGPAELLAESVYLGLRTADGLTIRQNEVQVVTPWTSAGWAALVADKLRLTPVGWLRLDSIAATLTSARSRSYS